MLTSAPLARREPGLVTYAFLDALQALGVIIGERFDLRERPASHFRVSVLSFCAGSGATTRRSSSSSVAAISKA